jgi:peptide/nickel transport system substrate-binding protein
MSLKRVVLNCALGLAVAFAASSTSMLRASAADGGTLVMATTQVPRHFNGTVQSGLATAMPSAQIFASPLRYDDNWNPKPYLAESWDVAPDGMSVTLHLVKTRCSTTAIPLPQKTSPSRS